MNKSQVSIKLSTEVKKQVMGISWQEMEIDIDTGEWVGFLAEDGPTPMGMKLFVDLLVSAISQLAKDGAEVGFSEGEIVGDAIRKLEENLIEI